MSGLVAEAIMPVVDRSRPFFAIWKTMSGFKMRRCSPCLMKTASDNSCPGSRRLSNGWGLATEPSIKSR